MFSRYLNKPSGKAEGEIFLLISQYSLQMPKNLMMDI